MDYELNNFGRVLKEQDVKEVSSFLARIEDFLDDENITQIKTECYLSKIFNEEDGIFSYIRNIPTTKNYKGILSDCFKLLLYLFEKFPMFLRPYYAVSLSECTDLWRSGIEATEKVKALRIMTAILRAGSGVPIENVQELYEKLFMFLNTADSKASAIVLKQLYILLGNLAKQYPNAVTDEKKFLNVYLKSMQKLDLEKSGATSKVCGFFEGLTEAMVEYAYIVETEQTMQIFLHNLVKKVINPKFIEEKRNDDCRSAVKFITAHSFILTTKCVSVLDYDWWYNTFRDWYMSDNNENHKVGLAALLQLFKVLSQVFQTETGDQYKTSFEKFYSNFENSIKDSQSVTEVRIALHGIGAFVKACKKQNCIRRAENTLAQIVNQLQERYLSYDEISPEYLENLPDFIKCLSSILQEMNEISNDDIILLHKIATLLVKSFPKLSKMYHHIVLESLVATHANLYNGDPKKFEMFLQTFVYQSLIWSCSHGRANEENLDDVITYKDFIPIWNNITNINSYVYEKSDIDLDVKKILVTKIFDEMIKTLIIFTTKKLNLKMISKFDENHPITDPEILYKPENADDFIIFLNIVDLFQEILSTCDQNLFRKSIKRFSKHMIVKSQNAPFVSGYYKLLSSCLKISDDLQYFVDFKDKEDKKHCFKMISKFIEDVVGKIQQFKRDLQLACLQLIFAAPTCFIKPLLPIMPSVFQVTFTLGLSYLKIADMGINTLERWYNQLELNDLKPLFKSTLPYLDPFLRSKLFSGDPDIKIDIKKTKSSKKMPKRIIENESELLRLQRKILMFVGQLDAEISLYMIQGDGTVETVPWEGQPNLKFTVPFIDGESNIYLDKLVPRLTELALYSSDTKTRFNSCEVLHGIFIVLLGTRNLSPTQYEKQYKKLFEKLMEPIIKLACDSNDFIKQIFSELTMQMIHWFTSPEKIYSFESTILINTLMQGVSHPTNINLRDYCGKCINECINWSIKQYDIDDRGRIYLNINKIIEVICYYCLHSNCDKRFGAAIAFNNLYIILREEHSMVDKFWIVLFYSFVMNLSLETEKINKERNFQQVCLALNHIERVFREKKDTFNSGGGKRKIPIGIGGQYLKDVVAWLLQKTGSSNIDCRTKCMELFSKLSRCVEHCETPKDFITKHIQPATNNWYRDIFENGIIKHTTLNNYKEVNFKIVKEYLGNLLKCLDGYIWLSDILTDLTYSENFIASIEYFINQIATHKLSDILTNDSIYKPSEKDDFNELKCSVIQKMFFLIVKSLTKSQKLLEVKLWELLSLCLFAPQEIGFDIINKSEIDKLNANIIDILNKFNDNLSENQLSELYGILTKYFTENYEEVSLNDNVPLAQRKILEGLLLVQKSRMGNKIVRIPTYFSNSIKSVFENLVQNDCTSYLPNSVFEYSKLQLELAFQLKNTPIILWECIASEKELTQSQGTLEDSFTCIKQGHYFLNTFKSVIINYFALNAKEVIGYYFKVRTVLSEENGGDLIMEIVKYLSENRRSLTNINFSALTEDIMNNCQCYFEYSSTMTIKERHFQVDFLSYVSKLLVEPLYNLSVKFNYIKNWFILSLLLRNKSIPQNEMLKFKLKLLSLLPCFTGPNDESNIPLTSTLQEYMRVMRSEYSNADIDKVLVFNTWLNALRDSKSRLVLECVATLYLKDDFKGIHSKINDKLVIIFPIYFQRLNITHQYESLKLIYSICFDRNRFSNRYTLAKIFLPVMLRNCSYDCFQQFYVNHIKNIIEVLNNNEEDEELVDKITDKIISFILIEVLFSRINVNKLIDKTCLINKEVNSQLGKDVLNCVKSVRKENIQLEEWEQDTLQMYHCHAFNAFVSFVSNYKNQPEDIGFYNLLFSENRSKNEILWNNIIDCNEEYNFIQNLNPATKNVFINIRKDVQSEEIPNYMKSQNIFNSSLSEDICRYDFNNTLLRQSDNSTNVNTYQIEFESVDLNNHECMATICGVIQHMVDNNITPLPINDPEPALPKWMVIIKEIMLDANTHKNVKLFFGRVIHNTKHIFQHYAKDFTIPIVKLITDGHLGNNINYFVTDLVEMLIHWAEKTITDDQKPTISMLVTFLMNNAYNDQREILKFNLKIIKTVVELWKNYIDFPSALLYKKLQGKEHSDKYLGVQVIGIVLANKVFPWTKEDINHYLQSLCSIILKDKNNELRKCAAEVIGVALKNMSEDKHWRPEFDMLQTKVKDILSRSDDLNFAYYLEHIQINYPNIIESYAIKIIEKLRLSMNKPALLKICLKNLLRYTDASQKAVLLDLSDVNALLNVKEDDVILLTLQLVQRTIHFSEMRRIQDVLNQVQKCRTSSNSNIREAMYLVFMTVHQKYSKSNIDSLNTSKKVLLDGLTDSDPDLQEKIQKFWMSEQNLPNEVKERYLKLLSDLYIPEVELHYLGYSVYFLLEACKSVPDYEKIMLFESPLTDCKFTDLKLNTGWSSQHASMKPMFSDSFASQFDPNDPPKQFGLRATTSLEFAPTLSIANSLESTSSFLFKTNMSAGSFNFIQPKEVRVKQSDDCKIIVQHSRRFRFSKEQTKKYYANQAIERKVRREKMNKERVKQRDASVAIYRNYRKGDFPDIMIPNSLIIKPLQELAKRDGPIARHLYVMLFKDMVSKMSNEKKSEYLSKIIIHITKLFNDSDRYVPDLIGALFDIVLEYKLDINPDLIVMLSKNTGLLSTGSLLLEEQISNYDDSIDNKKGCGSQNSEDHLWVTLADIYKEMNEWDGVTGIFSKKIDFPRELVVEAIQNESESLWELASESYRSLIDTDTSSSRRDFYRESYFKCFAHLSDWGSIWEYVDKEITYDGVWDNDWNQEKILPWFFTAGVYLALDEEENLKLLQCLYKWMGEKDKLEFIENKFCEELAVLKLMQSDLKSAKYYSEKFITQTLADWANLNPLYHKSRAAKLLSIQKIVDVNKYFNFAEDIQQSNYEHNLKNIINHWKKHTDLSSQSFIISEIKTTYRKYLVSQVYKTIVPFLTEEDEINHLKLNLSTVKQNTVFSFIDYSLQENNYKVAQKYVQRCKDINAGENEEGKRKSLQICKIILKKNKTDQLLKWWRHLDSILQTSENTNPNLLIETTHLINQYSQIFANNPDLLTRDDVKSELATLVRKDNIDVETIRKYGLSILRRGVEIGEQNQQVKRAKYGQDLTDAYMNLVFFMQKQNNAIYNKDIIKYVLRAMKNGSEKARQMFPYILRILQLNTSFEELFEKESQPVPTWMFIDWIPQLLSNLYTNCAKATGPIVFKIAQNYPQAIMFPYQLSKFNPTTTNVNSKLIKKLDSLLVNPALTSLISALSSCCMPQSNLTYHLQQILSENNDVAVDNFKEFSRKVENSSKSVDSLTGPIFKDGDILKIVKDIQNNMKDMNKLRQIKTKLDEDKRKIGAERAVRKLMEFSPWLANYQASEKDFEFEIPGQYKGDRKPIPQYHVNLASFLDKVEILSSLRLPIKLSMLGNDSKQYEFIVKFGEDLRQDQRIQQLFAIANSILEKDPQCAKRNMSIETYKVVPLSHCVGLIRWVPKTKSLKKFMFDMLDKEEAKECETIQGKYNHWITSAPIKKRGDRNRIDYYYSNACIAYKREQTEAKFNEFKNSVPSDILRRAFWSISMDTESFTCLRHKFITSYSVMCIIHWILGIGDRHLENILVRQDTGQAVGIDFGHAFGTATRNLAVPELIPFRLTPHIHNLANPLGQAGFVELAMVHCLRALRNQADILLSAMDVFVNEPMIGWVKIAQNKAKENDIETTDNFIPTERLNDARDKLQGVNPIKITIQELKDGLVKNDEDSLRAYIDIVEGSNSLRNRKPREGLSPEDQVSCLLDQATDYNILGRSYRGLETWI